MGICRFAKNSTNMNRSSVCNADPCIPYEINFRLSLSIRKLTLHFFGSYIVYHLNFTIVEPSRKT